MKTPEKITPARLKAPQKAALALVALVALAALFALACGDTVRRGLVIAFTPEYEAQGDPSALSSVFSDLDATREKIPIALTQIAAGYSAPTDIQFPPGSSTLMVVLEQAGRASWRSLDGAGAASPLLEMEVLTDGEQGLLGLAFHPAFADTGRIFTNAVVASPHGDITRIDEWHLPGADFQRAPARHVKTILSVPQPYQNHNAGQLAFGPDGMLYIGLGDGGFADDPHGHGQDTHTLLSAMLRVDVDRQDPGLPYALPPDNPFVGHPERGLPEIWAWGLRNPWRYSFAPDGRLIIADVGQDTLEEITIARAGENHGWKIREGDRCFAPEVDCPTDHLIDPAYTYPRQDGWSVTGGYVSTREDHDALKNLYVFGDFISGRIWAIRLPEAPGQKAEAAFALGKWPILISTFGRDASGRLYVADYGQGAIYRLDPPSRPKAD